MLASIAMDPMEFAFPHTPVASAAPIGCWIADPEKEALIEQIQSIEGATLRRAPLTFQLVLLCGGAICAAAAGGLVLGVADLIGRLV
jgi:hypothetical protein